MRERVRQTKWEGCLEKMWVWGWLFFRECCRRKEEVCGRQQVGEGSLCPWHGGNAGDNQPELGLGADVKRDAVLRVARPARVPVPALFPAWLWTRLRGRQTFCQPLASGEAAPALGWNGGAGRGGERSVLPPLTPGRVCPAVWAAPSLRKRKSTFRNI